MPSHPDLPFRPAAVPFFYGWVVVGAATIGILMSAPGQTIGVSVFTDFLIDALSLTRVQVSLAYLIGTFLSASILAWIGRVYDRRGARTVTVIASLGLGAVLVYLSYVAELTGLIAGPNGTFRRAVAFALVALGFFGIRLFGQGMLTLGSRNMVMKWFDRKRGLANAILGVSISFGFSYSPRVMEALIAGAGWQEAWRLIALVVGPVFALVALVLYRDAPEPCGLRPDSLAGRDGSTPATRGPGAWFGALTRRIPARYADGPAVDLTLREARRTLTFWVFLGALTLFSLTVTAFTFHIVSIFERAGFDRVTAIGIFLPISIIAMTIQFISSSLSDYFKLKYFVLIQLGGLIGMLTFLTLLPYGAPLVGLVITHAVNTALFGIIANVTWARYFGRTHLGAISGFVLSFQVGGSALGPYLFSLSLDLTGGYATAAIVSLVGAVILFVFALRVRQPTASVGSTN